MDNLQRAPLAAEARRLSQEGRWDLAGEKLSQLITEVTGVQAVSLHINRDQYSLNSLNGLVSLADHRTLFFKYHHEEGEEQTIAEYYRAELLREHGFLVDVPVYACGEPGRQILLYTLRKDPRLADVCREIETAKNWETMGAQAVARIMADSGQGGSVINICSLTSSVGVPGAAAYSSSKSGLVGLTRTLSSEWASYGIRINGIAPGYFETEMTQAFYQDETWRRAMQDKIPLGRLGELDDLTAAAVFFSSKAARYITGQILYIDGGYLATI